MMKKQTCRSLLSLSPQYQHPPPFTNWPTLNRLLFFYFFLITSLFPFFPFPILILPRLLLSSARLFVLCDTARQEGSVWMSVCESSFCLFFLLTPLVFLLLSVFGERGKLRAPFMYTEKDSGPILVSSIVTIHADAS